MRKFPDGKIVNLEGGSDPAVCAVKPWLKPNKACCIYSYSIAMAWII